MQDFSNIPLTLKYSSGRIKCFVRLLVDCYILKES